MIIIGCDYHPGFQQIAFVDTDTGECSERRLEHREEAEKFYRDLRAQGAAVRLGMEANRVPMNLSVVSYRETARRVGVEAKRARSRLVERWPLRLEVVLGGPD